MTATEEQAEGFWASAASLHAALFKTAEDAAATTERQLQAETEKRVNRSAAPQDAQRDNELRAALQKRMDEVQAWARERVAKSILEGTRSLLCDQWKYCEKRHTFETGGFHISVAIADTLLHSGLHFPFPVVAAAVYLVKHRLLDQLCACH